jgi:phosphinothricin acetyltransferase
MDGPTAQIRSAEADDLPSLVRIYNHYVTTTHHTFDTEAVTVDQRRPWFDSFAASGPYRLLVAEHAGRPVGYASSRQFRAKPAYRPSVETTIYLDPEHAGRGVGPPLYEALLSVLVEEAEVHRAYAGIALPNASSIAIHERLGFRLVGTFREVGFKFDEYWNVSWYEKDLS